MVTHDDDFLKLQHEPHAGIAYCAQRARTIAQLIEILLLIHGVMDAEEMKGRVEYL